MGSLNICSEIQSFDVKFQWEGPSVTGRPDSQVVWENSAANVTVLKSVYENIRQKIKFIGREENNFGFELENDYIPDSKIFDENTAEPDAAVEVSGKEVDELELDEGNKSNENNLNDLFIKYCF